MSFSIHTPFTHRIRKGQRGIRLSVYRDGRVIVTTGSGIHPERIARFMREQTRWIEQKLEVVRERQKKMLELAPLCAYPGVKREARAFVMARIEVINVFYRLTFNRVSIRDTRSRWGSCSRKGNLNFNYRLLGLPIHLADYVIVHELCHLAEFNHSPAFWSLVSRAIPDHKERRRELRRYGMHAIK